MYLRVAKSMDDEMRDNSAVLRAGVLKSYIGSSQSPTIGGHGLRPGLVEAGHDIGREIVDLVQPSIAEILRKPIL